MESRDSELSFNVLVDWADFSGVHVSPILEDGQTNRYRTLVRAGGLS